MTPAYIRALRSHANLVKDRLDKALQHETPQRKADFEWAQAEFSERYPHYDWREWAEKEKAISK